jgi:hypothetical protein
VAYEVLLSGLMSSTRGPRRYLAAILAQVWNLIAPGLWLFMSTTTLPIALDKPFTQAMLTLR